ncbi:MAG: hypothetical protein OEL55_02785 [Desulfobulbaceae bacterium]|nr:hypothetical protein [Desulfobulbaceae bacterium]
MLKDFFIFGMIWMGARFAWMVDIPAFHKDVFRLLSENHGSLIGSAFGVVICLVLVSYMCGAMRWHSVLYILSRLTFEISQFVLVFISCDAIVLWFDSQINLWAQLGLVVASLPFLTLGASCFGFWMYDFNYPLQDRIARNLMTPIVSGVIIGIASFL